MDPNVYNLNFPVFLALVGLVIWFFVQRKVSNDDAADKARQEKSEARVCAIEREVAGLRLELERRITRDELERVFDMVQKVSDKFDSQNKEVLRLLGSLAAQHPRSEADRGPV